MKLEDLVTVATSEPPPPRYDVDEIVAAGQRVQRRRRRGWAVSGAVAVVTLGVAAAVTVPALSGGAAPEPTAAPAGREAAPVEPLAATPDLAHPFMFTFGAYRAGKLKVADPIGVSTGYELAPVYADGMVTDDKAVDPGDKTARSQPAPEQPTLSAFLTVYRPGAYDPAKLAGARPVTVAGRPALEASAPGEGRMRVVRTLAWQYATDSWAVITARSTDTANPSLDELRELAAGLRTGTPAVAKLPVGMGYVPAGYRLNEVGVRALTGMTGIASARDGNYAGLMFSNPAMPTTGLTEPFPRVNGGAPFDGFVIHVVPAANANQKASAGVTCLAGFCNRWFDGGRVNVQVVGDGLSNGEMTRILEGITLADVADAATWKPVPDAVPAP
jgi:hypothetical protein